MTAPAQPTSVWAPHAQRVRIRCGSGTHDMTRCGQWWSWNAGLEHGEDYAYLIDDAGPFPDPRSPWQPHGVHGPSRHFDTSRPAFSDTDWQGRDVREAVIYELHVGTFTPEGTLSAAVGRLGDLVDLGVTMVELMPVAAFEGERGWGYDGVCLYAVHEAYGGPGALQKFVDAAHGLDLAVCLDVVYNHLGPSGNYLPEFGPYFTLDDHTPWGKAVNLDGPDSEPVRRFIIDNALRWFESFHLDALRLDAVQALVDHSGRHLLTQLSDEVDHLAHALGRPLSLIAESDQNDPATVTPVAAGGRGMTAQWNDDVHHAIHAFVTGERHGYYADFGSPATLAKALTEVFVHNGTYSSFRGRSWGRHVPAGLDRRRFVAATLTHDQVGNRGLGDRPAQSLDEARLAVSAALLVCSPFTPMLFMGQEWAASTPWQYFTDHRDQQLARAVREGREREFADHGWQEFYPHRPEPPDPQDPHTMAGSVLDHGEAQYGRHRRVREFYRHLLRLRAEHRQLRSGDGRATRARYAEDGSWFVLSRDSIHLLLTCTAGHRRITVPLPGAEQHRRLLSWSSTATLGPDGADLAPVDVLLLTAPQR